MCAYLTIWLSTAQHLRLRYRALSSFHYLHVLLAGFLLLQVGNLWLACMPHAGLLHGLLLNEDRTAERFNRISNFGTLFRKIRCYMSLSSSIYYTMLRRWTTLIGWLPISRQANWTLTLQNSRIGGTFVTNLIVKHVNRYFQSNNKFINKS